MNQIGTIFVRKAHQYRLRNINEIELTIYRRYNIVSQNRRHDYILACSRQKKIGERMKYWCEGMDHKWHKLARVKDEPTG